MIKDLKRKKDIERIRQINIKYLEDENDKLRIKAEKQINNISSKQKAKFKLKVKWNSNTAMYSVFSLTNLFSKYGQVSQVIISKKNNSAFIEFEKKESLLSATSFKSDQIEIEAIQVDISQNSNFNNSHQNIYNPYGIRIGQSFLDFENEVLKKFSNIV